MNYSHKFYVLINVYVKDEILSQDFSVEFYRIFSQC